LISAWLLADKDTYQFNGQTDMSKIIVRLCRTIEIANSC
jgi:hypothetical protein